MTIWYGLAALAAIYIAVLATRGERPLGGVIAFEPKGFLKTQQADDIRDVRIDRGPSHQWFHRVGHESWAPGDHDQQPLDADVSAKIEFAVKLMRVTAPERQISPQEMAPLTLADFGLDHPNLSVVLSGPKLSHFSVQFGKLNPLGLSRYARVEAHDGLWLLPKEVSDAWESVSSIH